MAFQNDVVGGITLVRAAIRSPNYVPNVSGWTINRDGTAEFADGTFRGAVVVVQPGTGLVLASIGANGNASFQNVNVAGDILIGTQSVLSFMNGAGRGVVGIFKTTANLPFTGINGNFLSIAWTSFPYEPGRLYKITASCTQWINTNTTFNQDMIYRLVLDQDVTGGANNDVTLATRLSASGQNSQALSLEFYVGGGSLYALGPMTVALQAAATDTSNRWNNLNPTNSPFYLVVEDVGPVPTFTGGTGAPSGSLTYTVSYPCLASRSYSSTGAFIGAPDGNNNMYRSTFPDRPFGAEQFECIFNGAQIRSDLGGATVTYARLWLYCVKCEEAAGTLDFGVTTDTAVQGTLTDNGTGSYGIDDDWPVPGWQYYDMLSEGPTTSLARILSGGNGIIGRASLFGLAATGFSGFGGPSNQKPFIEIRYSGSAPGGSGGYGLSPYGQVPYGT